LRKQELFRQCNNLTPLVETESSLSQLYNVNHQFLQ